jgi:hypothetical protein
VTQTIQFEGQEFDFPDEATDSQIKSFLRREAGISPESEKQAVNRIFATGGGEPPTLQLGERERQMFPRAAATLEAQQQQPTVAEAKTTKGFLDTIKNPIKAMKEDSIVASGVRYLFTPQSEFDEKAKVSRDQFLMSIPAITTLNKELDLWEKQALERELTPQEDAAYLKLQDAYGEMWKSLGDSYDKGEFEEGFSLSAMKEAALSDPGGTTAHFINAVIADPELLLTPLGWTKAAGATATVGAKLGTTAEKIAGVAGGIGGAATVGGVIAGTQNTAQQLAEKGEVDTEEALGVASIGAVTAPLFIGGIKGTIATKGAFDKIRLPKQAQKAFDEVNDKALEHMIKGANKDTAIRRAAQETNMSPRVKEEFNKKYSLGDDLDFSKEAVQAKTTKIAQDMNSLRGRIRTGTGNVKDRIKEFIGVASTTVHKMSPVLGFRFQRHGQQLSENIGKDLRVKDQLSRAVKPLSSNQRRRFNLFWNNSDIKAMRELASELTPKKRDALLSAISRTRAMLDRTYGRGIEAGIKIGRVPDFFPRQVADYQKYMQRRGINKNRYRTALADAINIKYGLRDTERISASKINDRVINDHLTDAEVRDVLSKKLLASQGKPSIRSSTEHTKKRQRDTVSQEESIIDYSDSLESLTNYIHNMNAKIESRNFFGGAKALDNINAQEVLTDEKIVNRAITSLLEKERRAGNIIVDDIPELEKIFTARFLEGVKSPNKLIAGTKNLLYTGTLANPLAAGTQLGDLGAAAYLTSIARTAANIPRVISRQAPVNMETLGLTNLTHEMEHLGWTARVLQRGLQFSGFRAVDRLGKETILNASLGKLQAQAKSTKGLAKIKAKYEAAFTPEEMDSLVAGLKNKELTFPVRHVLWHELAKVQPISLEEMPVRYMQHPNGRIFYMLKTFTIKQLDILRRDFYNQIRRGNTAAGVKNLVTYGAILGTANASVENVKSWIKGEDVEFSDLVMARLLGNYGLSQYTLKEIGEGKAIGAAVKIATPPYAVLDYLGQDMVNMFKGLDKPPKFAKGWTVLFDAAGRESK